MASMADPDAVAQYELHRLDLLLLESSAVFIFGSLSVRFNSLTTKKQTTKFSSAKLKKNKIHLSHIIL